MSLHPDLPASPYAALLQDGPRYGFVYVDQHGFAQHKPQSFSGLVTSFREYQDTP